MAHPKSRISKQRRNKRRTHHGAAIPQIGTCSTTGQNHIYHRAHWHEGAMYYRGKLVIAGPEVKDSND